MTGQTVCEVLGGRVMQCVRWSAVVGVQILARTDSKEVAVKAYAEAEALPKTTSGQRLDIELNLIRIGMFWSRPCTTFHPL